MNKLELMNKIEAMPTRSAWSAGVKLYALDLVGDLDDQGEFYGNPANRKELLNGADDWNHYSWSGCSLIYDGDIASRLCTPSEFKRKRGGQLPPNNFEQWLDVQARALNQAARHIMRIMKNSMEVTK